MIVTIATPEQQRERDRLTHAAWGERLTVEQFMARETRLRGTPWAKNAMTTWLLIEGERVLCSLETFRVESRFHAQRGSSYEVASVFTAPEHRGRGFSTELLGGVIAQLADAQAVTLYSDVGAALYERSGFVARPGWDSIVPARRNDANVERLRSAEPFAPRGRFALVADAAQLDWHRERERAYAALLGRAPLPHGALRCDGGVALLAGDLKHERLLVLDLRAEDERIAQQLLDGAADEAARHGLRDVVAWTSEPASPRDGALPMIRPLAPGLAAEDWTDIPRLLWV
jgi:GNAT superfamily N-acetyltransferase